MSINALPPDIIRLLAVSEPECANGLIRCCKEFNRCINDDTSTMKKLSEYYCDNLYKKLQKNFNQLFAPDLNKLYTAGNGIGFGGGQGKNCGIDG